MQRRKAWGGTGGKRENRLELQQLGATLAGAEVAARGWEFILCTVGSHLEASSEGDISSGLCLETGHSGCSIGSGIGVGWKKKLR